MGSISLSCEDILDLINVDADWFRERVIYLRAHPKELLKGNYGEHPDLPGTGYTRERERVARKQRVSKPITEPHPDEIRAALSRFDWEKKKAAEFLGINRTTLRRRMQKYGINPPEKIPLTWEQKRALRRERYKLRLANAERN